MKMDQHRLRRLQEKLIWRWTIRSTRNFRMQEFFQCGKTRARVIRVLIPGSLSKMGTGICSELDDGQCGQNNYAAWFNHNEKLNCRSIMAEQSVYFGIFFLEYEAGYRQPVMYPSILIWGPGENMEIQDLFEKNADYKSVIRQYVDSCQTRLIAGMQHEMKEHVRQQHFNYWNLLPSGICFFTRWVQYMAFTPVPYSRLDPLG